MNNFTYLQPKSLDEAGKLLRKIDKKALPLAGGTDVLGMMKDYQVSPESLINLKGIPNLNTIEYTEGKTLEIGALATLVDIAENKIINDRFTVLADAARQIASPQFRNIATLGGNLCQRPRCFYFRGDFHCLRKGGDICYAVDGQNKYHCIVGGGPCYIVYPSDAAVALLALDAEISIYSNGKSRLVPIKDFFILPEKNYTKENILEPGELVEKVIIPDLPKSAKSKYIKFMEREVWDFAMVSVGAVIKKNGSTIAGGNVAFGGVAPIPWQIENLNKRLTGLSISETSFANLSKDTFKDAITLEHNAYKVPLVRNLLKRVLIELTAL
jgi:xanthine dehydrogenase YagS FAD-binding subunit